MSRSLDFLSFYKELRPEAHPSLASLIGYENVQRECHTFSSYLRKRKVGKYQSIWKRLGNKCCDPQDRGQKYEEA